MYISDISGKNNSKRSRTDKNKIQTDNSNSTSNFNSKGVADPVTARVSSIQHNYIKAVTSKANTHPALKTARHYAIMAAICLIIGIVYEIFSHDVISVFMIGAFIIPLVLGVLANLCIRLRRLKTPCHTAENAYACGIITLTEAFSKAFWIFSEQLTVCLSITSLSGLLLSSWAFACISFRKKAPVQILQKNLLHETIP